VVQVNLDFAIPRATKSYQVHHVLGPVLFLREEKRMSRRSAVGIAMPVAQSRIVIAPPPHSRTFRFVIGIAPTWLEMIHKTKHDMHGRNVGAAASQLAQDHARQPIEYTSLE